MVAGTLRPGYDPVTDAISRLAELGAPNRWIVTSGMIAFGLGALVFAGLLRRSAAVALVIAGLSSFAVATFPCTQGCPGGGSFTDVAHVLAAAAFYVAFVLVPLLHHRRGPVVVVALVAGAALALHGGGVGPNGLLQRSGLTILDAWLVVTALGYARAEVATTGGE